jgi:hypothetical protein
MTKNVLKGVFLVGLVQRVMGCWLLLEIVLPGFNCQSKLLVRPVRNHGNAAGLICFKKLKGNDVVRLPRKNITQLMLAGTSAKMTSIFLLFSRYIPVSIAIVLLMQPFDGVLFE